jgi:hypothetical protein
MATLQKNQCGANIKTWQWTGIAQVKTATKAD